MNKTKLKWQTKEAEEPELGLAAFKVMIIEIEGEEGLFAVEKSVLNQFLIEKGVKGCRVLGSQIPVVFNRKFNKEEVVN